MKAGPIRMVRRAAAAAATFFSGGVDSFYSVVANESRYDAADPSSIRSLVNASHPFIDPLWSTENVDVVHA